MGRGTSAVTVWRERTVNFQRCPTSICSSTKCTKLFGLTVGLLHRNLEKKQILKSVLLHDVFVRCTEILWPILIYNFLPNVPLNNSKILFLLYVVTEYKLPDHERNGDICTKKILQIYKIFH